MVYPAYPKVNQPLKVKLWKKEQIPSWVPPTCLGWKKKNLDFLMASAGRFVDQNNIRFIVERVISFSNLTNITYWSVSNGQWRILFDDAGALSNSNLKSRRRDFNVTHVLPGSKFYYVQDENTLLDPVAFRMTIHDYSPDRLVFSSVNVSPFRVAFFEAVKAGGFEQYYIIQREFGNTWLYYSIIRSKMNYTFLAPTRLSSISRGVAYFRYVAGRPYKNNIPFVKN